MASCINAAHNKRDISYDSSSFALSVSLAAVLSALITFFITIFAVRLRIVGRFLNYNIANMAPAASNKDDSVTVNNISLSSREQRVICYGMLSMKEQPVVSFVPSLTHFPPINQLRRQRK